MQKQKNVIEMATGVPTFVLILLSLMKRETARVAAETVEMLLFWKKNMQLLNFDYGF